MNILSYKELTQSSDIEIGSQVDSFLAHVADNDPQLTTLNTPGQLIYVQLLANELSRRSQDRQTKSMTWMTKVIVLMTLIILISTILGTAYTICTYTLTEKAYQRELQRDQVHAIDQR